MDSPYSHLLSVISTSRYFERFFVSPAGSKWQGSTVTLIATQRPYIKLALKKVERSFWLAGVSGIK